MLSAPGFNAAHLKFNNASTNYSQQCHNRRRKSVSSINTKKRKQIKDAPGQLLLPVQQSRQYENDNSSGEWMLTEEHHAPFLNLLMHGFYFLLRDQTLCCDRQVL